MAGFLYRRAVTNNDETYVLRWMQVRNRLFPTGLVREATTMAAAPAVGVVLQNQNAQSYDAGLRKGDIIVGVDGWRVETKEQFDAVWQFDDQRSKHRVTVWRGALQTTELAEGHDLSLTTYSAKPNSQ